MAKKVYPAQRQAILMAGSLNVGENEVTVLRAFWPLVLEECKAAGIPAIALPPVLRDGGFQTGAVAGFSWDYSRSGATYVVSGDAATGLTEAHADAIQRARARFQPAPKQLLDIKFDIFKW